MYAIEFETIVKDKHIEIPDYEKFAFKHVKVVLMTGDEVLPQKEDNDGNKFWMNASQSSIDAIWNNDEDNVYIA